MSLAIFISLKLDRKNQKFTRHLVTHVTSSDEAQSEPSLLRILGGENEYDQRRMCMGEKTVVDISPFAPESIK